MVKMRIPCPSTIRIQMVLFIPKVLLVICMVTYNPHEILLLVTDFMLSLHPPAHFLIPLLSSTSSNGVLSVVCTIGFDGLLFLVVILNVWEDASAVYCDEPLSLATTSHGVCFHASLYLTQSHNVWWLVTVLSCRLFGTCTFVDQRRCRCSQVVFLSLLW